MCFHRERSKYIQLGLGCKLRSKIILYLSPLDADTSDSVIESNVYQTSPVFFLSNKRKQIPGFVVKEVPYRSIFEVIGTSHDEYGTVSSIRVRHSSGSNVIYLDDILYKNITEYFEEYNLRL
jgi:ribosomal protein S4E